MDIALLFENNKKPGKSQLHVRDRKILFTYPNMQLDAQLIKRALAFGNELLASPLRGLPVVFQFPGTTPTTDKLAYILFECICRYLLEQGIPVQVRLSPKISIDTAGLLSSPLQALNDPKGGQRFEEGFSRTIHLRHYRGILPSNAKKSALSVLMTEVATFQKIAKTQEADRDEIAEVFSELVGNANEHTNQACLYDLDISGPYQKQGADASRTFRSVNLVVLNFSAQLLGSGLREKLKEDGLPERYRQVQAAYSVHKRSFGSQYTEEDFYTVASFQDRISGRETAGLLGGTGLTKLIHSLENKADAYKCYMQSGERQIIFDHRCLAYDANNWIGFNAESDFLHQPPDPYIFRKSNIYLPGTAYNLTFIMEEASS